MHFLCNPGKVYHPDRAAVPARPACCADRPIRPGRVSFCESAVLSQSVWRRMPASFSLCASPDGPQRAIRVE